MWTIAAVAIGDSANDRPIVDTSNLDGVRRYIAGLIDGLIALDTTPPSKYRIGIDYKIEYRERAVDDLPKAKDSDPTGAFKDGDVIFCMSTTVVQAAQTYTDTIKIVAIVSDPGQQGFDKSANICGFSAERHQTADICFDNFINSVSPPFTSFIVLHKPGYYPSENAKKLVESEAQKQKKFNYSILSIGDATSITSQLNTLKPQLNTAIIVLPVDLFFANADDHDDGTAGIISQAQNNGLPTFFFTTDWVRSYPALSAFGGYGVPQYTCGVKMAERVHYALTNPGGPRWTQADKQKDFQWKVSGRVANAFGLKPTSSHEDRKKGPIDVDPLRKRHR